MDSIIFEAEFDFYTEVLSWATLDETMSDVLTDTTWSLLKDSIDQSEYERYDRLAGEQYLTRIELDGATVRVAIYDDDIEVLSLMEERAEAAKIEEGDWLAKIEEMAHEDMCRMYRFAPTGHPCFVRGTPICDAYFAKFDALGGMTTIMSKRIGHGNG